MATEIEIDAILNTDRSEQSLSQLRKGLKDLVSLQGQVGSGSDQFRKLQKAINDTEGKIGDLTDSFRTLRGSGVERLNSSIGLLREGFLSADPGKLSIAMEGLGSAMKAIPIFLLIEGFNWIVNNFGKITEMFSESAKELKRLRIELEDYTLAVNQNQNALDRQTLSLENQLKQLQRQGAPLDEIIKKLKEIDAIKQEGLRGELSKTDKEIQLQLVKLQQMKDDLATRTSAEELGQAFGLGLGTTEDQVKQQEQLVQKLSTERGKQYNAIIAQETATANIIADLRADAEKKQTDLEKEESKKRIAAFMELMKSKQELAESLDETNRKLAQEEADRELEAAKKIIQNNKDFKQANAEAEADVERQNAEAAERRRRLRSENQKAWDQAFQQKTLAQKIDFLEKDRDTQLQNEQLTQEQRIAIIEKAENEIFQLKVKKAQEWVSYAQQVADLANSINTLANQNENQILREQQYARDAALQNEQNRTQEALDGEERKKNQLLNNDRLTSAQREKIAYDSETRQRQIANASKDAQVKITQDFAKKELEVKKKQFERQKALQIATGIINTAASVLQTLASVPYPANIPLAILTGLAGAAQVAIIANQKFDDGGAGAMNAVSPAQSIDTRGGVGSQAPTSQVPRNFDPTGNLTSNNRNTANSNGVNRVVVLESDIRKVSSKVDVLEERATFAD